MPDLRSLGLLVRLAECGSYTQASRQMGVSVGAASKMITRLEKELGIRLLNRNTRLTSLTHQGQLLAEKANRVLEEMTEAIDLLQIERGSPLGTVKALIASPIARGCIFPLLPRFQDRYPQVQLEISCTTVHLTLRSRASTSPSLTGCTYRVNTSRGSYAHCPSWPWRVPDI